MLPPQSAVYLEWGAKVQEQNPNISLLQPKGLPEALEMIQDADAAFGFMPKELLANAGRLKWLQAPQIAPPAGFYYQELIEHPVVVTNFREIFNDHIGAHIMAFVLAFSRGLHYYLPQQIQQQYKPRPLDTGVVHLPEASALIIGVGGIGCEAARLCKAFGMHVAGVDPRRTSLTEGLDELFTPDQLDNLLPKYDENQKTFVEPYLPNYKIGIMHLAAGIWKDGKDMRVDKSIKIELETLDNKKINKSLRFDT